MPLPVSSTTTFPVEQVGAAAWPFNVKSESDLPNLSPNQSATVQNIKDHGGHYLRFVGGDWLPPHGNRLAAATRQMLRATDRTIISLIRSGYLVAVDHLNGKPVRVTLTFP